MAKKKAKWLEESATTELLDVIKDGFNTDDEKVATKAAKALDEVIERTPDSEEILSVEDAVNNAHAAIDQIVASYKAEIKECEDDEEDEVEEEAPKVKHNRKSLKGKKAVKGDEEDEEDSDEEEEDDLSSKTKKELITMAKELGIPSARKKSKEELIDLINDAQDDDSEEDSDEDEEFNYDDLSKKELLTEIKERGLKASRKLGKEELIKILEEDDDFEEDED